MTELPDRLLRDALDHTASTAPSMTCVDVERLAAWADGTITGAERSVIETHAAGCARCLGLLAAMTRTEPPPIAAPWWRRSRIAWLLPLAAVTAGLVIVVRLAVLEQRSGGLPPTAAPAAAAPPLVDVPQAAPAPAQPPVKPFESNAPALERRPRRGSGAAESGSATRAPAEEPPKDTAAPAPSAAPRQTVAPLQTVAPVPAGAPAAAPVAPPAPPPGQELATSAIGGRAAGGRGGGGDRDFAARNALKAKAAAPAAVVIASPDRDSEWRIVSGTVEHTADGGATWQPQAIGVVTAMRAGAAPAARVCWVVGAAGVVLRTTDGTTWTRIPFPEPSDLVAIQASDASHVVVTTADGRRFTTSDAGATWVRP
jgi:hypothetical protein